MVNGMDTGFSSMSKISMPADKPSRPVHLLGACLSLEILHAPHHFQGVCRKALAGQLVVHGAWLHAPVVVFA